MTDIDFGNGRHRNIRARWIAVAATAILVPLLLTVSIAASSAGVPGSGPVGSAAALTPAQYVAAAKKVVKAGESGFLSSPFPDKQFVLPTQIKTIKRGGWTGPTSAPPIKKGAKVIAISCLKGSGCDTLAQGVSQAGKVLGWNVKTISTDGTPAGEISAFNAAIAQHPAAIVGMSISPSIVGLQLSNAHKAGIKTLEMSAPQGPAPPNGYDYYMASLSALSTSVENWIAMADSNGKANVSFLWDSSNPQFAIALKYDTRALQMCGGCKLNQVLSHPVSQASDAVAMGQLTTSLIQKSGSGLGYIVTPYDTGVAGIIAAVKQSSNPKIKVMSINGEPQQVAAVASGDQFADVGKSLLQQGWAGADDVVRLLANKPAIPLEKEGMAIHIFTKQNAPRSGNFNWEKNFGYQEQYEKAWGLKKK